MKFKIVFAFGFFLCIAVAKLPASTGSTQRAYITIIHDTLPDSLTRTENIRADSSQSNWKKERLIASILAFPVPFGFCGLHRIYLGSEPWVPVAYLITGGGGFGILPLADFIFLVTADEEEFRSYENNSRLFMWVE